MSTTIINHHEIREILPQDYPFIMIDKVIEFDKGKSLVAVKNITANEWFFEGREFNLDSFPETLLIEAAAQAALILYHKSKIKIGEKRPQYILGKIEATIHRPVGVGDSLLINALATKMLHLGGYSNIKVLNENEEVANFYVIYSVKR